VDLKGRFAAKVKRAENGRQEGRQEKIKRKRREGRDGREENIREINFWSRLRACPATAERQ